MGENQNMNEGYNQAQAVYVNADLEEPISVGDWFVTMILLAIPVVNIIMFIIWLVSGSTKKSKKNYLIACLIFVVILMVLLVVLMSAGAAVLYNIGM